MWWNWAGQFLAQREDLGHDRDARLGGSADRQPVHGLAA
jgi:hypothetical protein